MINHLKFWCNKVLPCVYDDSLSYYELLCKVVNKLNEVIDSENTLVDEMHSFAEAVNADIEEFKEYINTSNTTFRADMIRQFNEFTDDINGSFNDLLEDFENLQEYVDNYFNNLDLDSVIEPLFDEYVEQGHIESMVVDLNKKKIIFIGSNSDTGDLIDFVSANANFYNCNVGQSGGTTFDNSSENWFGSNLETIDERTDLSWNETGWYTTPDAITDVVITTPSTMWAEEISGLQGKLYNTETTIKRYFKNAKIWFFLTSEPSNASYGQYYNTVAGYLLSEQTLQIERCVHCTALEFFMAGRSAGAASLGSYIFDAIYVGADLAHYYALEAVTNGNIKVVLYKNCYGDYSLSVVDNSANISETVNFEFTHYGPAVFSTDEIELGTYTVYESENSELNLVTYSVYRDATDYKTITLKKVPRANWYPANKTTKVCFNRTIHSLDRTLL